MMRLAVLVLVVLLECAAVTPEAAVAERCREVVRDFATVVRGEPGDREAHAEALHVLSTRLKRLRGSDRSADLVDETIETLRKMRRCDYGGRVGKCLHDLERVMECRLRFADGDDRRDQCVQSVVGAEVCRKRARHGEMVLRRHEDALLRDMRARAAECNTLECEKSVEQSIATEERRVKESRRKRKHTWQVCDDSRAAADLAQRSAASEAAFPAWAIAVLIGGVFLVACLVLLIVWLVYKRRQQRVLEEITRAEMVY